MRSGKKAGFTIVELSLSIAFIAILSITIVLIITNTISAYHRGLTLNQINTTGMDLVDDIRAAVQNSPARSIVKDCAAHFSDDWVSDCENDNAKKLVVVERFATVQIGNESVEKTPVYGAFCTGAYSYIWNSGYFFNGVDYKVTNAKKASLKYKLAGSGSTSAVSMETDFKLLKVEDKTRSVCLSAAKTKNGRYDKNSSISLENDSQTDSEFFDITSYDAINEKPIEVLTGSNMTIYHLDTAVPAESSSHNNIFYSVSFVLGTIQGGINIKSSGNYCAAPSGYNSAVENFDYCAINKFNFAAQATGV